LKRDQGCTEQSDEQFLQSAFICERMDKLVAKVNAELNHWEQIRSYRFVNDDLSIEDETLTPTMKVRRHVIEQRYATLIDSLYEEGRT
jgi:long-chain acyl-CoA synthetase